jgi:hypothetical protein
MARWHAPAERASDPGANVDPNSSTSIRIPQFSIVDLVIVDLFEK